MTVNVGSEKQANGQPTRNCKNCGKPFVYKHWNKRFCSDECRIENWEKRTGKTLTKKSKK
ncbi:MAG: hypothetical protein HC803_01775 [Saprospiraceae bacterium]|nr:hypothetical protein [Saprospiraceae bacterium]